jgi:hypothetical protein
MKARHFRRIRKNLKNKIWLEKKLSKLFAIDREMIRFHDFECSVFFKGRHTAEHNLEIYYKRNRKNNRRISFIHRMITKIEKGD